MEINIGLKRDNNEIMKITACLGGKVNILSIIVILFLVIYLIATLRKIAIGSPGTLGFNAGNAQKIPRRNAPAPRNPYRATSIVHDDHACEAVKAIGSKRFLDTDRVTPTLPLPDCDAAQCNCKYAQHKDRREFDEDRRNPNKLPSELYDQTGKTNRRTRKRGRRKTDWA